MKVHLILLCTFFLGVHLSDDIQEKMAQQMLSETDDLKNTPTHKATKQDLQDSYNQMMELENSPEEKAKMDQMMEQLAGITSGSGDSLATSNDVTGDTADAKMEQVSTPEPSTTLKDSSEQKDARKLEISDPTLGVPSPNADLMMKASESNPDAGRKLNIGMSSGGANLDAPKMDSGFNKDMVNMQNSFDDMNSTGPGMETGGSLGDLDGGMHEQATNAIINRMDQTNQERMAKLNQMFPEPGTLMPKTRKKKKSHVISIKNMLKNYPPQLVSEFMPELKDKVMSKFDEMRRERKRNHQIRKLKKKLQRQKRRERERRRLRERRRRRALQRRRRRRHHHRKRRRTAIHSRKWRPHFSMRDMHKKQFHSIAVMNKFMHRRPNQLHRFDRLRERKLEEINEAGDPAANNSGESDKTFMDLEKQILDDKNADLESNTGRRFGEVNRRNRHQLGQQQFGHQRTGGRFGKREPEGPDGAVDGLESGPGRRPGAVALEQLVPEE